MEAPASKIHPPPASQALHRPPRRWPVILIGLDKLTKAVGLVVISFFLKQLPEHRDAWLEFVTQRHLLFHLQNLLVRALSISEKTGRTLDIIAVVGAGLYLIEGVGLIWDLKWAEWLVLISTASLVPLEVYEIVARPSWMKCAILVINLVIVAYLSFRLHRLAQVKRERQALGSFEVIPPEPKKS